MTKVGNSNGLRNHMDAIKSLATKFGIPIILFGTYELLSFRNLSGQLIRRGLDVHLSRYNLEVEGHQEDFQNVLWVFQKMLLLKEEPDLVSEWKYYYQRTIGCVGVFRDWLLNTYKYQSRKNNEIETISISDFEKFEISVDQAIVMADEIIAGEKLVRSKNSENTLRDKLNINDKYDESEIRKSDKKNTNNPRPGVRKSKRDKTGIDIINNAQ